MRTLAHYTVYGGSVYHLHVFDFGADGSVAHSPVDGETADTMFVEGLLLVSADELGGKLLMSMNGRIAELSAEMDLGGVAQAIAAEFVQLRPIPPSLPHLYAARFPFAGIQTVSLGLSCTDVR